MQLFQALRSLDWVLNITALLLVAIGLAMVFSAAYDTAGILADRFVRQIVTAAAGCLLLVVIARWSYIWWRRYAFLIYILGMGGLLVVSVAARVIRGTTSRFSVAGLQIQPSEFMRVALVVMLAYVFARLTRMDTKSLFISFAITIVPVSLILLEPDVGMASLLIALWIMIIVFLGVSWPRLAIIILLSLVSFVAGWQWVLADYQKDRLLTFLNPAHDPLGAGYNITQSIVALGSGQVVGRGLGHGPQSRLQFLPEQHTDFIFASIGEELGFVGISVVLLLYAVLLWRILKIAQHTKDQFGRLLAIGTFSLLLVSLIVSAGMNIGLLPVTGIALPLVSYGGSSLLTTFILLGIVQSVAIHSEWTRTPPAELSNLT